MSNNTTYIIETRPLDSDDPREWTTDGIGDIIEFDSVEEAWATIADLQREDAWRSQIAPSWYGQYRVVGSDGSTEDAEEASSRRAETSDD